MKDGKSLGSLMIDEFVTRNVVRKPPKKKKRMSLADKLDAIEEADRKRIRDLYAASVDNWRATLRSLHRR